MSTKEETWLQELFHTIDEEEKMTDKQRSILQAAVEIFSEKGYSATSTSEIAQKAGVAEGTIFRHYKTKKDLLLSIVAPLMGKMIAPLLMKDFSKVLNQDYSRYEDLVRAVLVNRIKFARNNMPLIKIMLHEVPLHPELQEQLKKNVSEIVIQRVSKVVVRFQEEGQIIALPPVRVMRLTASVLLGFVIARFIIVPEYQWDDEEEIEACIQFILYGLTPRTT